MSLKNLCNLVRSHTANPIRKELNMVKKCIAFPVIQIAISPNGFARFFFKTIIILSTVRSITPGDQETFPL